MLPASLFPLTKQKKRQLLEDSGSKMWYENPLGLCKNMGRGQHWIKQIQKETMTHYCHFLCLFNERVILKEIKPFTFINTRRRSVLITWLGPKHWNWASDLYKRHLVVVMRHYLLSLNIVGTLSILINPTSLVTSTSSETAATGYETQCKCL